MTEQKIQPQIAIALHITNVHMIANCGQQLVIAGLKGIQVQAVEKNRVPSLL